MFYFNICYNYYLLSVTHAQLRIDMFLFHNVHYIISSIFQYNDIGVKTYFAPTDEYLSIFKKSPAVASSTGK